MDDRVKNELKKGLESANQLRLLFADRRLQSPELVMASLNHHSSVVLNTFESAISMLKTNQCVGWDAYHTSPTFNHDNKRTSQSQSQPTKVIRSSVIPDDGYCWRKYGRKPIANTKHPREYYRCGHQGQGCQARKQVQIVSENPTKYGIIYYGHHTCQNISINDYTSQFNHLFVESNDNECPNMLSFESTNIPTISKPGPNMMKQELMVVNEDMPHFFPHDENIPPSSLSLSLSSSEYLPSSSSLLSSSEYLPSSSSLLSSSSEYLPSSSSWDVGLPQWCYSMDSPLFSNEDVEFLMTHGVDFERDLDDVRNWDV